MNVQSGTRTPPSAADDLLANLIEEITQALQRGEPVDMEAYALTYPDHAERLRRLVPAMLLLEHAGAARNRLEATEPMGADQALVSGVLGDFRILREIGRGGMGVVYEAEQISLGRRVALKVLPFAAVLDPRRLQRFQNEAHAAASLKHPNIVRIYSVGCERGVHHYAMEHIEGRTLAEVIDELRGLAAAPAANQEQPTLSKITADLLSGGRGAEQDQGDAGSAPAEADVTSAAHISSSEETARRPQANASTKPSGRGREFFRSVAQLGMQAAEALEHAHQMGVVHRDIKPSNLMIDAQGHLWITDFGLAMTQQDLGLTMTGDILGTLRYMSPEQAQGQHRILDHRTDIYSLGVTLYEMLTLQPPFTSSDRHVLIQQIVDRPPRPPRQTNPATPPDLETIVLKTLAKNPTERYATAQELANDLRRFLQDEPIRARRPTPLQKARKWCARHRPLVVTATVVAAIAAVVVAVISTVAAVRLDRLSERLQATAEAERNAAQREREAKSDAIRAEKVARERAEDSRQRLVRLNVANGIRLMNEGNFFDSLVWFAEALKLEQGEPAKEETHRTRFAAVLQQCPTLVQLFVQDSAITHAEFSPDGRKVLTAAGRSARVWDAFTGGPITPPLEHRDRVTCACFNSDGSRVLTASDDQTAQVWDAATGRPLIPSMKHGDAVRYAAFSPDGRLIVTLAGIDATLWDAATGEASVPPFGCKNPCCASFSPDSRRLVMTSRYAPSTAQVWDVITRQPVSPLMRYENGSHAITDASFSPDGGLLLTVHVGHAVRLWNAATGQPVTPSEPAQQVLPGMIDIRKPWAVSPLELKLEDSQEIKDAEFSPDGRWVVTASRDQTARVWDARTGKQVLLPLQHAGTVNQASFSPDSRFIATASDELARVWDATTGEPITPPLRHGDRVGRVAFGPESRRLLAMAGNTVRIWDLVPPMSVPLVLNGEITQAQLSSDGRRVITFGQAYRQEWDATTGVLVKPLDPLEPWFDSLRSLLRAMPKEGRLVNRGGKFEFGRAILQESSRSLPTKTGIWNVVLADLAAQKTVSLSQLEGRITSWSFSQDGSRLVTATTVSVDGRYRGESVQVWNTATVKPISRLPLDSQVQHVSISPDGRRVATANPDGTAIIWDADTAQAVSPPLRHRGLLYRVAFSPDGTLFVTASADRTARVWDAQTGKPRSQWLKHPGFVTDACFSSDGRRLATVCQPGGSHRFPGNAGEIRIWDAASGEPLTPSLKYRDVRHVSFGPTGSQLVAAFGNKTAWLWELVPDERPIQDLYLLAHVLASSELDDTGDFVPLEPARLQTAWDALRSTYPGDFDCSAQEVLAWHRREAARCEACWSWSAAVWHLDRLIELEPSQWQYWVRRGYVHFYLGDLQVAETNFTKAVELVGETSAANSANWDYAQQQALEQLLTSTGVWRVAPAQHYQRAVATWQNRAADFAAKGVGLAASSKVYNDLAWLLVTCLDPTVGDSNQAIELAKKAVELNPRPAHQNTLGVAYYRAGNWREAIKSLETSIEVSRGGNAVDWIFLAMSYWQLGKQPDAPPDDQAKHQAAARKWYKQATEWMEKNQPQDEELLRFRAEAEKLLN